MLVSLVVYFGRLGRQLLQRPLARLLVLAVCAVVLAVNIASKARFVPSSGSSAIDFILIYGAAQTVLHGGDPYVHWLVAYPQVHWFTALPHLSLNLIEAVPPSIPFDYAPFVAYAAAPLTLFSPAVAVAIWACLQAIAIAVAIYCLLRLIGTRPSLMTVLVLTTCATYMDGVRDTLYLGNIDAILLLTVCAAFYMQRRNRPFVAGIILGIGCATKPYLLAYVAYLLWKREYRFALTTLVSTAALVLVPFTWLGAGALARLIQVWREMGSQFVAWDQNESLRGLVTRLFTVNPNSSALLVAPALGLFIWAAASACVVLVAAAMIPPGRAHSDRQVGRELGLVTVSLLIIGPLIESHYLTLLIIPLVSLVDLIVHGALAISKRVTLAACMLGVWFALGVKLKPIHQMFAPHTHAGPIAAVIYGILADPYLVLIVAVLALQVHAMTLVMGSSIRPAVRSLLTSVLPAQLKVWRTDVVASVRRIGLAHAAAPIALSVPSERIEHLSSGEAPGARTRRPVPPLVS